MTGKQTAILVSMGILLVSLLSACASRAPEPNYYRLNLGNPETTSSLSGFSVGIGPVFIPERLMAPKVLLATSAVQVKGKSRYRWSEPLDDILARELSWYLGSRAPKVNFYAYPWPPGIQPNYSINLQINRFEAVTDTTLELSGTMVVSENQPAISAIESRRFQIFKPIGEQNINALVIAHSKAGAALGEQILSLIEQLSENAAP